MAARFPMAVVVVGSPLTVTIEGASAVVAAEDFVGGLTTDDRVQAAFLGDRLTVLAKAGGAGGGSPAMLSKTDVESLGGVAGTANTYGWETEVLLPTGFTRTFQQGRLYVDVAGWYEIDLLANAQTEGAGRTTLMGWYALDGGANRYGGTIRGYTRGSSYGNVTFGLRTIAYITAGQYIQVGSIVEATDGTYVINSSGTEVGAEETRLIVRRAA